MDAGAYKRTVTDVMEGLGSVYRDREKGYARRLDGFYSDLIYRQGIARQAQKLLDRELSTSFNVFDYIRPDENGVSDVIADLLRPDGIHGQGVLFLDLFLSMVNVPGALRNAAFLNSTKITREAATYKNRRIDILIELAGSFAIGVENKILAADQSDQVKDYVIDLEKKYGRNFTFVYLHSCGSNPSQESISPEELDRLKTASQFVRLPYDSRALAPMPSLKTWVDQCQRQCRSQKFRYFLQDFIVWIEKNSGEEQHGSIWHDSRLPA